VCGKALPISVIGKNLGDDLLKPRRRRKAKEAKPDTYYG
jgi:hypothetical protein